jgi:hypothetical protein
MFRLLFNILLCVMQFVLVPCWYPISGYPLTLLTLIDPWTVFTQFLATSQFLFFSFRLFLFIQFSFQLCCWSHVSLILQYLFVLIMLEGLYVS